MSVPASSREGLPSAGSDPPLVSVIMPVYNGGRFLGATLPSVAAQTHPRVECIAADDGSTDDSREILARQGNWRVERVSRLGANGARRAALAHARGTYVAFLDQDDLWHPGHLAACVRILESCPEAPAAVGRRSRFKDGDRPALIERDGPFTRHDPWGSFPIAVIDSPSMVVVRRAALDRIGGWPEEGGAAADCLAWWRLGALGAMGVTPGVTVGIREVAGSMSDVDRQARRKCLENIIRTACLATDSLAGSRRSVERRGAESLGEALAGVLDAVEQGRPIGPAALQWERTVADLPDALVLLGARFLGWLFRVDPRTSTGPEWQRVVDVMLLRWPAAAPRTGREMRRWVAVSFAPGMVAAAVRREPTRIAAWTCLAECIGARVTRPIRRGSDPRFTSATLISPR